MHRSILLFLLAILFLFSCRDKDKPADSVLSQPPFDQLTDSISESPNNSLLYYKRGTLLFQNNQLVYAEQDLRKAWQLQPIEEYALRLVTILKEKDPAAAVSFLEEATAKIPGSIALQIGLARGYQQQGTTDKAIAITDRILEQFPGQLDALTLKSEILGDQNKPQESIAYLEKAYSLVPSDPALAYDLAYEYAMSKNRKNIRLTDSLISARTPEIEKAYYTRGLYYSNTGNSKEAIRNFDLAIQKNYNFNDAYLDKGKVLFRIASYDEALKTFDLALKIDPTIPEFYFWKGKVLQAKGQKEDAKLNYQKAFGLDKSYAEAKEAAEKL